jgi:hypothetical protein
MTPLYRKRCILSFPKTENNWGNKIKKLYQNGEMIYDSVISKETDSYLLKKRKIVFQKLGNEIEN